MKQTEVQGTAENVAERKDGDDDGDDDEEEAACRNNRQRPLIAVKNEESHERWTWDTDQRRALETKLM